MTDGTSHHRQAVDHAQLSHCPVAGNVTKHLWQVAAEAVGARVRAGLLLETFCCAGLGGASLVVLPSRSRAASARLRFLDIGELLATVLPSGGRPTMELLPVVRGMDQRGTTKHPA